MAKPDLAHNMGFVSQSPFIFDGTIQENLLYSCEADLPEEILDEGPEAKTKQLPNLDRMIEVLQQTGIFADVLRFGLNATLRSDTHAELISRIIAVREGFQEDHGAALADYVEFFDEDRYLYFSPLAANLCFGASGKPEFAQDKLADNEYFLQFLDEAQLRKSLLSLGVELAEQTIDILGSMPPDSVFFEQSPLQPEQLEAFRSIVDKLKKQKLHELDEADRHMLLGLALSFIPGRHKMVALPELLETLILDARALFKKKISQDDPGAFSFYQKDTYIASQAILDNILFGKTKTDQPQVQDKINQSIIMLLIEQDMLEAIAELGMQFRVGTKGDRLSGGQKQKLAIARSFIKEPPLLIMDEATSALDNRSQSRIQNLIETKWKRKATIIAVVHRLDIIKNFDKIAVMKAGKIVEIGTYDELIQKKGSLYELVYGSQNG